MRRSVRHGLRTHRKRCGHRSRVMAAHGTVGGAARVLLLMLGLFLHIQAGGDAVRILALFKRHRRLIGGEDEHAEQRY